MNTILLIALLVLTKCEALRFVKKIDQRRCSMTLAMRRFKFSKQSESKPLTRDRNNNDKKDSSDEIKAPATTNGQQSNKLSKPAKKEEKSTSLDTNNNEKEEVRISFAGSTTSTSSEEVTMNERAFQVVSNLLLADFFVVIGFLLWFVVGISTQSTAPEILQTFCLIFRPVVVSALTVLLVGSLAKVLFNKDYEQVMDNLSSAIGSISENVDASMQSSVYYRETGMMGDSFLWQDDSGYNDGGNDGGCGGGDD